MSEKNKVDKKTELTFQTVDKLKNAPQAVNEFINAAQNYQKALKKLAEAGKQMADAMSKVSQLHSGDIGQGIAKMAEIQRAVEAKHEALSQSIQQDLIGGLDRNAKTESSEISFFENDYKKVRASVRSQITKLEDNTKKAGKKNPELLKQSIAALNDKVKEAETIKSEKLRTVLLIERKKYCNFLTMCNPMVNSEIDVLTELSRFKENQSFWSNLAASYLQLPNEVENIIKTQERTLVAIQGNQDEYSYSNSWNTSYDSNSYSNYDTTAANNSASSYNTGNYGNYDNYNTPASNYSYNQPQSYSLGTCTALYNFAGEQAEDLPFYAGDIITVLQEDDGSGWLHGELNGVRGIFPSSYVQRN